MQDIERESFLSRIIQAIREDHPTLSCRSMYYKINPEFIGRDKFEALCRRLGYKIEQKGSSHRTTDSSGVTRFENHLEAAVLKDINQAYSSDITYFEVGGRFYFITFILDCFSRRILGFSVSKTLTTEETTLPALKMAIRARGGSIPEGTIFHSDGGGQYYDKAFLRYTKKHEMLNSMCEYAYENGKAERLNGIIKNNYLRHYCIKDYESLLKNVDRAVDLYNSDRPHKALNYRSPVEYEKELLNLRQQTKPKMKESFEAKQIYGASSPINTEQTKPQTLDVF
jgi:hypothetical protein